MKSPLISMFCSAPKLLAGLLGLASLCSAGSALAQARYSFSEDGAEVTDSKTGLVWQRCSAGQVWKEDK